MSWSAFCSAGRYKKHSKTFFPYGQARTASPIDVCSSENPNFSRTVVLACVSNSCLRMQFRTSETSFFAILATYSTAIGEVRWTSPSRKKVRSWDLAEALHATSKFGVTPWRCTLNPEGESNDSRFGKSQFRLTGNHAVNLRYPFSKDLSPTIHAREKSCRAPAANSG